MCAMEASGDRLGAHFEREYVSYGPFAFDGDLGSSVLV